MHRFISVFALVTMAGLVGTTLAAGCAEAEPVPQERFEVEHPDLSPTLFCTNGQCFCDDCPGDAEIGKPGSPSWCEVNCHGCALLVGCGKCKGCGG